MNALIAPPYSTPRAFMVQLSHLYPYPALGAGRRGTIVQKQNWPMPRLSDFSQTFAVQASRDVM